MLWNDENTAIIAEIGRARACPPSARGRERYGRQRPDESVVVVLQSATALTIEAEAVR
jgi:hypothetical protein